MYYQIEVSTTSQATEAISEILIRSGSHGVMIEDPLDFQFQNKEETRWDYIEEDVFKYDHEDVKITGYFSQDEDIKKIIQNLQEKFDSLKKEDYLDFGTLEINQKLSDEKEWEDEWKKYFHTTKITDKIVIKPGWEEYHAKEQEKIIDIDPGLAFGTGTHETTKMCIQAIEEVLKKEDTLLDIGTGSGILAITAGLLGAKKIIAVDNDKMAVRVAKENIAKNNLSSDIEVLEGNLADLIKEQADVVVANIIADAIIALSQDAYNLLKENGYFISSGIIEDRAEEVQEHIEKIGFQVIKLQKDGSWNMILAKK